MLLLVKTIAIEIDVLLSVNIELVILSFVANKTKLEELVEQESEFGKISLSCL